MDFRRIFGTISFENVFVEKPKLGLEYLSQDESGSCLEIFTTDSGKDKEQNVLNKYPLEVLSFFFVNCIRICICMYASAVLATITYELTGCASSVSF